MPRAALLSIHARMEGTGPSTWDDPSLVQVWGPRYHVYVVDARDLAVFTLGRLPDAGRTRRTAEDLAARLHALLSGRRMPYDDAGQALAVHPNALRYAALTGTVAIRWEGAGRPTVWTVPTPEIDAAEATRELARRFVHVFGPTGAEAFARWAGMPPRQAARAFLELDGEFVPVRTPFGEARLLARDEAAFREPSPRPALARLLPSGDAYTLGVTSGERALLVRDAERRGELWTPRVWPGAVLVAGEIAGTWRRAQRAVSITAWRRLSRNEREAVVAEAEGLPLPNAGGRIRVELS